MMKIHTISPLVGLARYEHWKLGWEGRDGLDEYSYIAGVCNPEDVLLSCKLFFPDFVSADNGVFLDHKYDRTLFEVWFDKFGGDMQAVEKMINHTHLYDVFDGCPEDVDDRVFEQLAEVVALSWRLILSNKFPDKKFNVDVSGTDQDYGPVVTFYQMA